MKKAISVMLLALLYAKPSTAQTDSLRREIGFSTQIIFDNIFESDGAPVELMFKKHRGENKWTRYGISLTGSHQTNNVVDAHGQKYENSYISFSPSVGLEHRKNLLKKWNILYGGDLYLNLYYSNNLSNYFIEFDQIMILSEQRTKSFSAGAGFRPFLGLAFNVTPRFYVSTEAYANVGTYLGSTTSQHITGSEHSESESNRWGFDVNVRPASAIFVYYRF